MSRGYRDEDKEDEGTSLGEAVLVHHTDKALLVRLDNKKQEELWIPRSQLHMNSEIYSDATETGTVVVTNWWAKENGRPEYDGD